MLYRLSLCLAPAMILPRAAHVRSTLKFALLDEAGSAPASSMNESTSSGQQDWSAVWECFESPYRLLSMPAGGLSKSMQVLEEPTFTIPQHCLKLIKDQFYAHHMI